MRKCTGRSTQKYATVPTAAELKWEEELIDHIIVGAPSLTAASQWLTAQTGIQGQYGGQTPHNSTHNMLYRLPDGGYLEILCPDPANLASAEHALPFGLDTIEDLAVVGWAARVMDLHAEVARADAAGVPHGEVVGMSRTRPDGVVLTWTMTYPCPEGLEALLPVLIDWGATEHPSTSLRHLEPLTLERFELHTHEHATVSGWFDALGLSRDVAVVPGETPQYGVVVAGPRGGVSIGLAPAVARDADPANGGMSHG